MRKFVGLVLIAVMVFAVGCGGGVNYEKITDSDLQKFASAKQTDKLLDYIDHYYSNNQKQVLVQSAMKLILDNQLEGGKEALAQKYIHIFKKLLSENHYQEAILFTESYHNAGGLDKSLTANIINQTKQTMGLKTEYSQLQKNIKNLEADISAIEQSLPDQPIVLLRGYMIQYHGNNLYEFAFPETYDNEMISDKHALLETVETRFSKRGWFEEYSVQLEDRELILTEEAGGFEATWAYYKMVPQKTADKYISYNEKKDRLTSLYNDFSELQKRKSNGDIAIIKLLEPADAPNNKEYLGLWTTGSGMALDIIDAGINYIVGTITSSSSSSDRTADVDFQGLLFDNQLDFEILNDGWFNRGSGNITLSNDNKVIINLILDENKSAEWSIGNGEFILQKDSTAPVNAVTAPLAPPTETLYAVETGDEWLEPQQAGMSIPGGYYYEWDKVTSSSTLSSDSSNTYFPSNAVDQNDNTAWVEGVDGPGINEWIYFENYTAKEIALIQIHNGFAKNEKLFFANNRPKKIRLDFSDGQSVTAVLQDGFQRGNTIDLERRIKTKSMRITILEVYPGNKYDDTCIAEVWVF